MKHKLFCTLGLTVLALVGFVASPAGAATAAGPYYANPSWDQTLSSDARFIVLSNMGGDAVLDRETGLVWEKSPDPTPRNWFLAQRICNEFRTIGNRRGWRTPTLQELASLVDPTRSNPALPAGHPFIGVQPSGYWSATTSSAFIADNAAWYVNFTAGTVVGFEPKVNEFPIWCVRGGQGVDPQ